jgi:hypothetical protein
MFDRFSPEAQRIARWLTVIVGSVGGFLACFYAFLLAMHVVPAVVLPKPGDPMPEGMQVIPVMIMTAILWCWATWHLARLWYEPHPPLAPGYVLGARIVRSVLVFMVSAGITAAGYTMTFPLATRPLPLFGIGVTLLGLFGFYTIYLDWRHGDRPAGFQRN